MRANKFEIKIYFEAPVFLLTIKFYCTTIRSAGKLNRNRNGAMHAGKRGISLIQLSLGISISAYTRIIYYMVDIVDIVNMCDVTCESDKSR